MKKIFLPVIFLLILLIPTLTFGLKKWTILVYMNADNNLEQFGIQDFMEMSSVGSDSNIDIVVQFDRISGYDTTYGNWTDCMRFHITSGLTPAIGNEVMDLGEVNMGSPTVLSDFVNWGIDNYPSEKYLVVIWNHGDGWTRGFTPIAGAYKDCSNDETSNSSIGVANGELESALSTIYSHLGRKIDILGFDACLMQMWEVAVEAQPYVNYMVGSEETEGGAGWVYDDFLGPLAQGNGAMTPVQLGDKISSTYVASNQPTCSCIDVQQIPTLNTAVNNLAKELMIARYQGYGSTIESLISSTQGYLLIYPEYYYGHIVPDHDFRDLQDFCELVSGSSLPTATKTAANDVITVLNTLITSSYYKNVNYDYSGSNGLSIYLPVPGYYDSSPYTSLTSCSTYWDEFISGASMEPGPTEVNMSYVSHAIDDSVGGNNDGQVDALETVDMTITLKNNETTTVTGITGVLSTTDTYVTINSNTSAYPDVAKLKSTTSTSAYNFSVAKACPAGHVINFTLDVTTNQGSKEITFTVTVVDPAPKEVTLVYNSHSIDDSVGGNNDGEPDAGESIAMNVSLKNTNIDSATSVSATISTTNTYVTITDNSANYPDINGSNGTGTSTSSYQFDISQNCPAGEIITFNLNITANEGTWTDSFTIQVIDKYVPPPIVEVNGGAGLFNPEWSWTGTPRKIAFIQYNATGQSDIYVINSNGTLPVKISSGTEGISHVSQISWSPDDSKIIFAAGDPLKLYTLASNGSEAGNPRLLMPEGTGGTLYYKWVDPDWSNTTNQYGNVERVAVSISGDIWVFEPNAEAGSNSGTKRITNLSDPYIDQANIDKCYQPHWNNNNTEIVFVRRPAKRTNRVADTDIYKATGIQSIISGATHPIGDPDGDGIGGDWTDPRLVKVSNSTNPEYSPSYSIDGTQISYNRDSANLFNNYTFYTTPVTVVGNCNFDAYSSLSTMSSYHNPAINEGFMKWSSAGGDLFTYIEENNGTYYLRVIEDPTIGGFTRNIAKNSMLTIQDRSFTTLSISGEDASDYNQVTIKSLHTCPFIRFQEGIAPLGEYREFLADGKDVNLNDNAVIGIRFALQELKGRSKEELVICRLDGDIWKEIPSYVTIDKENLDGGIVKASIDKLGVYGIFLKGIDVKKAVADNTEIRIFPNPFKYTNPSIYTSLGEVSVVFDKINPLADEVEITIYSISGEVIAKMSEDEKLFENVSGTATTSGRAYAWNVCCRSKETVASGVYLAVIEVDGEEYIKKIAVIK